MKKVRSTADVTEGLRTRAEKLPAAKGPDLRQIPPEDIQKLVHELQAHQIELELQNEELRRTQEALAEAQDRYASLYDCAPVAYFTLDPQGLIVEVNFAGLQLLGVSRASIINKPFLRFVEPEGHEEFRTHLQTAPAGGPAQSCDLILKPDHGAPFPASLESLAIFDTESKVVQYQTVVRNITRRQQVEKDLCKSEALYRLIVETANEGIWVIDGGHHTTYVNPIMSEMLGYRMEEMLDRPATDFLFPEDLSDYEDKKTRLRHGLDVKYERRFKRKDGSDLWCIVSARSFMDDRGQFQGAFAMFTNITLRKQAEEALRMAAHQWQTTFDAISEAVCLLDLNCRILGGNQAMATLVGKPVNEIIGRPCYELMHGGSQPIPECPLATMLQSRQREEVVLSHKERWLKVMVDPILDETGAPIGAVHRIADITPLKKSEEALRESEAHFRQLFESGADAIILHDRGRIVQVNQQACRSLGYTREELLGLHVTDLEVGIDRRELLEAWKQDPPEATFSGIQRRKDGTTFPVEIRVCKFPSRHRNLFLAVVRDITAQRQAERAMSASETLFRSLFENMLNGFAYCKMLFEHNQPQDFIYLEVNGAFEALTGLKNVVGKKVSEVIPGMRESDPEIFEIYGRVALTGKPEVIEAYVEALQMWFSVSVYSPAKEYFVAVFDVITERKRAEEVLTQQARFLQLLIDTIPTPVFYKDGQGRYLGCNKGFLDYHGLTQEEIVGKTVDCLPTKEQVERYRQKDLELLRSPGVQVYEDAMQLPDGTKREVVFNKATFLKADGAVGGLIGVITDITELKQAQKELRALAARMAELEEKERHILARELHDEVGQGLTALGLNLTLIQTQMPREAAAPLLNRLTDAVALVEKTGETIRNVMAELRPPVLDDYGLLSALRWYGGEFSRRTSISVEVQGEEAAPRLTRSVELALFRIAQEALTNVAKHAGASRVELYEEEDNGTVRLVIADNGVGFDRTQVGQPKGRYRWGLMNMSERAAAAGGSCRIESQPGQGTRVVVEVSREVLSHEN
jgi:PAS domain S-box-containing protein